MGAAERQNRGEEKYELPTPYLLFSIKQIFFLSFFFLSNGSCRSRLGGTSIPITMLPTHAAHGDRQSWRERERRRGGEEWGGGAGGGQKCKPTTI